MKHVDQVSDGSGEVGAARITSEVLEVMIKVTTLQEHNDEERDMYLDQCAFKGARNGEQDDRS